MGPGWPSPAGSWTRLLETDPSEYARALAGRRDGSGNFFKDAAWSPDGSRILAVNNDHSTRVFAPYGRTDDPLWRPLTTVAEGEPVRATAWHPAGGAYLVSKAEHPIVLRDANAGGVLAVYSALDTRSDAICAPYSLAFTPDGTQIAAGFDGTLAIFNMEHSVDGSRDEIATTALRGRMRRAKGRGRRAIDAEGGLRGVVSALAFMPQSPNCLAAGTFSGALGLYDTLVFPSVVSTGSVYDPACKTRPTVEFCPPTAVLGGAAERWSGITRCVWLADGVTLVASGRGRGSRTIAGWDVRRPDRPLFVADRGFTRGAPSRSQQRLGFDVVGSFMVAGSASGSVRAWDLSEIASGSPRVDVARLQPIWSADALEPSASIVSAALHPFFFHDSDLYRYLLVASGARAEAGTAPGASSLALYHIPRASASDGASSGASSDSSSGSSSKSFSNSDYAIVP